MAVSFTTERAEDADTSNTNAYTVGAEFTPGNDSLLILALVGADNADTYTIDSVAGGSLTWNNAITADWNNGTTFFQLDIYYALVGTAAATTVVVTYSEALTGCSGWIGEFAGHHATTPIHATNQTSSSLASGTETMSLPNAPATGSYVLFLNSIARNPAGWDASGDGWTEHADTGHSSPASGFYLAGKAEDQTITYSGTNGTAYGVMVEIVQAAAPPPATVKTLAAIGVG